MHEAGGDGFPRAGGLAPLVGLAKWGLVGLLFYCPLLGSFLLRCEVGSF